MTDKQFVKSISNSRLEALAGSGHYAKLATQELERRIQLRAKQAAKRALESAPKAAA